MTMTPEQLRNRAGQFQGQIRRRNVREFVCAGIVVILSGLVVFDSVSLMTRIGAVMTTLWALYFIYALNRFGSANGLPGDFSAQESCGFHRQQLERQRALAMSRPWGIALSVPGTVLFVLGMHLGGKHPGDWQMPIIFIGAYIFVCIAVVLDGHMTADRLQREIDSLNARD